MDNFLHLPEEKQAAILDGALITFGNNGYKKASVSDIAKAAGISKAMVFHYFGTKKSLYLFLIKKCYDLIVNEVNEMFDNSVTDFFDRIIMASNIKVSILKKNPNIDPFLTSVYFEDNEDVKEDIKTLIDSSKDFSNKIAFDGMDTSKFKDNVDPKQVMKILLWMADGFANSTRLRNGMDIETLCNEFYDCMYLLKNNLYKEEYL